VIRCRGELDLDLDLVVLELVSGSTHSVDGTL
jgi:hypothetical protein